MEILDYKLTDAGKANLKIGDAFYGWFGRGTDVSQRRDYDNEREMDVYSYHEIIEEEWRETVVDFVIKPTFRKFYIEARGCMMLLRVGKFWFEDDHLSAIPHIILLKK